MDFYATCSKYKLRAFMPANQHYLLPASSWFDVSKGKFVQEHLPVHASNYAVDCGGFVAARIWGDYRYSAAQYIEWIESFALAPEWAAIMDYCCEDEITTGNHGVVTERQDRTTANIESFWQYRDAQWAWIPTIQGWDIKDYIRHAVELKPLIQQWQAFYKNRSAFRVGIGTLCARPYSADIRAIVCAVADVLPNVRFHLWGVKLQVLQSVISLPRIASVDSAAWSVGGLGRDGIQARDERASMMITQRAHDYLVSLPRYRAKIEKALAGKKQFTLWN